MHEPCSGSWTAGGMTWLRDPLAERRAERERLLDGAREYVDQLSRDMSIVAAAVGGSVARGDFNVWSDVDVLIVSDGLPAGVAARTALLAHAAPPRLEPHGYTVSELRRALERRDRFAMETVTDGIWLVGRAAV
jgi:uncharacterized protein